MFGLSFTPPRDLCRPKNFSMGSCDILSLKKHVTSGMVNKYGIKSMKECTAIKEKTQ